MTKDDFARRATEMTDRMYRVAYSLLYCDADCRDAMQEAVLKAWEKRQSLRREEYFETWVIRILLNECHDRQRRARRELPLDSAPEPVAPDFAVMIHE